METTSVILPSYGRPKQLYKCCLNLIDTAPDAEIIVVLDNDNDSLEAIRDLPVRVLNRKERGTCISAWNDGAAISKGNFLVAAADDFFFYPRWLEEAIKALDAFPDREGLVALNDLHHMDDLATIFLMTRKFAVESMGGVIYCPYYRSFFCDNEVTLKSKAKNRFVWAKNSIAEHRHWANSKAVKDKTYDDREQYWDHDRAVYSYRIQAGFPNDYTPSFGL